MGPAVEVCMSTLSKLGPVTLALVLAACADVADGDDATLGQTTSAVTVSALTWVGHDRDWSNPRNWSAGRVPGPNDDVVLADDDDVLIDGGTVVVRDVFVRDRARLEVVHGAMVTMRQQTIGDAGWVIFRASADMGDTIVAAPDPALCAYCGGIKLNPNPKTKRFVVLQSSVVVDFGLGGLAPASIAHDATGAPVLAAGPGHYSTMTVNDITLAGELRLTTYYGFAPRPGDQFEIIKAERARGRFDGLDEGAYVGCTPDDVCLAISYSGGDGNDVVLSAERADAAKKKRMHKPFVITKELDKS